MSRWFSPGSLVTVADWVRSGIFLYSRPATKLANAVVGRLDRGDIALVIMMTSIVQDVYVCGPHGCGWTTCGDVQTLE